MSLLRIRDVMDNGSEPKKRTMTEEEYEQMKCDSYNRTEGKLHEQDGYECTECKNRGYIAKVSKNGMYFYETLFPCKCQTVRQALARLRKSGLQNVVKEYKLSKFETPEPWQEMIKKSAAKFCQDDAQNHWFFIGGQSGCGKSHLCTAIAVKFIKLGLNVKYMLWRDEIAKIKAIVTDAPAYEEKMRELKEAEVLYIDDLFKTGKGDDGKPKTPTAADVNAAFEILNHRYNNPDLITIISSERTIWDLCEIDEAIAGRIAERTKAAGYCWNIKKDPSKNWRMRDLQEI